jgi:hypothetical protein
MRSQGVTVSDLAQGIAADLHGTVFDVICQGVGSERSASGGVSPPV